MASSTTDIPSTAAQTPSAVLIPATATNVNDLSNNGINTNTTNSTAPTTNSSGAAAASGSDLSTGDKVGLGLGIGIGVILLLGVAFYFLYLRKRHALRSSSSSDKTFGATTYDAERDGSTIASPHPHGGERRTIRGRIGSPYNFRRPGRDNTVPEVMRGYDSGHSTPLRSRSVHDLTSHSNAPSRAVSIHSDGLRSHPVTPVYDASVAPDREKPPEVPFPILASVAARAMGQRTPPSSAPRTPTSAPRSPTEFATPAEFPPLPHPGSVHPSSLPKRHGGSVDITPTRRGSQGLRLSIGPLPPPPAMPQTPLTPAGHRGGVNSGETPPGDSPTLGAQGEPTFIASIPPGANLWSHTQRMFGQHGGGFTPTGQPALFPGYSPFIPEVAKVTEEELSSSPELERTTIDEEKQLALLKDEQAKVHLKKLRLLELRRLEEQEEELEKKIEEAEELRRQKSATSLSTVKGLGLTA